MTHSALERQLGGALFEKARACFNNDGVLWTTEHDDGRTRALVSERNNLYTAIFSLQDGQLSGSCSCRTATVCRHLGAAALALLKERNGTGAPDRLGQSPGPGTPSSRSGGWERPHRNWDRFVFLLDRSANSGTVTVKPAYRTTRSDGMPGNFIPASDRSGSRRNGHGGGTLRIGSEALPGSDETERLIAVVGIHGSPLASVIEMLTTGSLVPVFGPEHPYRRRAGFDRVERMEVKFRFERLTGGVPYFRPELVAHAAARQYEISRQDRRSASATGSALALLHEESETVLYTLEASGWIHLFDAMEELPDSCGPAAAGRLERRVAELGVERVSVSPPPKRVQYVRDEPVPVLRLSFDGSLSCSVRFRYGEVEVGWTETTDPIVSESGGSASDGGARSTERSERILIQRRNFQAEHVWRSALRKLCPEEAYAFEIAYGSGRSAVLSGTQAAFLVRYGESLLSAGFHLMVAEMPVQSSSGSLSYAVSGSGADWLDVEMQVANGAGAEPAVLEHLTGSGGIVRSGGRFIVLTPEHLQQVQGLAGCGFDEHGRARLRKHHVGVYDAIRANLAARSAPAREAEAADGGDAEAAGGRKTAPVAGAADSGDAEAAADAGDAEGAAPAREAEAADSEARVEARDAAAAGDADAATAAPPLTDQLERITSELRAVQSGAAGADGGPGAGSAEDGTAGVAAGGGESGAAAEELDLGGFRAELRGYQQAGLAWLRTLHRQGLGGCLADDMGLGKTVQTLSLLSHLHAVGELERALCVVPISTLGNWEREIERFAPHFTALRHIGSKRSNDAETIGGAHIVLVSYSSLRNDIELFRRVKFDYLVLDEAQTIKNPNSKIFHAVRKVDARARLALTGTPVENNTVELWSVFEYLNPGMMGSLESFRRDFGVPIEREADDARLSHLQTLIRPFLLRRRKHDVAPELPPREETTVWCEMGTEQRRVYDSVRNSYRERVRHSIAEHGVSGSSTTVFEGLLRLRQIAILPALAAEAYEEICSEKYELVLDQLQEVVASGNKVIVFSQFTALLKRLAGYIGGRGTQYAYLDGSTRDRQGPIDRFQNDPSLSIFLVSLKAGGVGLNLTAADYVFLVDPWWNPAVEAQAIDRAHRIGRTKPVIATRFITSGTVEEKIRELQLRKQALAEQLMGRSIGALSPAEVLSLFE